MRCGTDCVKNVAASIDLCRARRANSTNSIAYGAIPGRKTPVVPLSSSCSTIDASDVMVAQDDPDQAKNSGRRVRFSDEQGGPLVTGVRTMTSWWDELVFGADTCSDCGHCPQGRDAPSGIDIGGITQTQMKEARCEGCGGIPKNDPPGELFYFIEELTQGVEVTLGLPGLVGKRRQRVLLYTVDNGESLCWREAFSGCGAAYRLPCSGLLEVTEKSGATVMAEDELDVTTSERESNETGDMTQADDQEGMPSASLITSSASHAGSPRIGNLPCDGSGSVTGERGIRIRLRWRASPTFPVRKVTITDVHCSDQLRFARGLLRLRCHNVNLFELC